MLLYIVLLCAGQTIFHKSFQSGRKMETIMLPILIHALMCFQAKFIFHAVLNVNVRFLPVAEAGLHKFVDSNGHLNFFSLYMWDSFKSLMTCTLSSKSSPAKLILNRKLHCS